jgi:hypothetical protein
MIEDSLDEIFSQKEENFCFFFALFSYELNLQLATLPTYKQSIFNCDRRSWITIFSTTLLHVSGRAFQAFKSCHTLSFNMYMVFNKRKRKHVYITFPILRFINQRVRNNFSRIVVIHSYIILSLLYVGGGNYTLHNATRRHCSYKAHC